MDGGVRECASIGAGEEVLDQGAEVVELVRRGVPAEQRLAGVGLENQSKHVLLVFDIDFDLVFLLGMRDSEAGSYFDFGTILGSSTDKSTDYTSRLGSFLDISADCVVKNRKDSLNAKYYEHMPRNDGDVEF